MSDIPLELSGLSTNAALESLTNIILSHKNTPCLPRNCLGNANFWKNLLHHNSFGTTFCWIPATILILIIIFLFYLDMWMESFILLTAVILNILLVTWDNYLRINELNSRIIFISEKLKYVQKSCDWSKEYFPHLCTPNAPSVSLQWTIRDGKIVNLPTILLTVGDLIIMRPGQQSPVECCVAQKIGNLKNIEDSSLSTDEVFSCHGSLYKLEQPNNPTVRHPLPNRIYKVTTPPIVTHLELLKRKFLDRPVSLYNRASHLLFNKFLLQYLLPATIVIVECICLARWLIIPYVYDSWWYMFVMEPVVIILSLIPYAFPVLWFVINTVGNAFLLSCTVSHQATSNDIAYTESMEAQMKKTEVKFSWKYMSKYCFDIICGSGATVTRSGNLLHTLASVTSLCCVDKKGILSWPNPTAEKLFFLRDTQKTSISNLDEDVSITKVGGLNETDQEEKQQKLSASIEILDLTHDNSSAWKLQFDDVYWDRYITSLKPLGLAILLNTCNSATHEYYSRFCAHITCQSLFSERLVPVTNRRCLCELARLIGFKDSILQKFDTELQLSTYRNVGDIVEMDTKYMKTFFKRRKLKFPFPHMVSVSVNMIDEKKNGSSIKNEFNCSWDTHLFSQGTADIILDCCTDFWNGYDIIPMTLSVRNKILDFYQRSSLTAYCTAFSYRPLLKKLDKSFTNVYVELPRDRALCSSSTNSMSSLADNIAEHTDENDALENFKAKLDASDCYKAQRNQVFLGMISMQYQALADMVQLIEELEKACIRFVHFSKENELRSRVFSEKMGLESGWNCHISLLDTYNSNVFSESLACLGNFNYARCNFSPTSSNNSSRSYNLLISNEESPYNINVDSVSSNATETRKQRRSVDQSSESDLSYIVEENVPLGFDMSNRSKLPRGIENIRPHLQEVDNVPLLVSLFTDCTPEATREMISIMQENGEVVCVLGSSANIHNVGMFVQADASIAIDPLYPQVCQREAVIKEFSPDHLPMKPIQLSQLLNSIGCSLTIRREDPLPVFHLIMQSRHIMQHVWNCMQFWLCCMAILAVVQMLALICMLPPMFTIEQILWINCVVIPLLSVSLLNGEVDESIMNKATGKDWLCSPNIEIIIYLVWCYGAKLIVAIFSTTSMYGALLYSLCHEYSTPNYKNNSLATNCSYVYFNDLKINSFHSREYYHVLFLSRHVTSLMLVLHYVALCTSFLFREYLFWKKVPCFSVTWLLSVFSILIAELVYILDYEVYTEHIFSVDMPVYLLTYFLVSPLLTFIICEIIKVYEIRANKRYHRKVRLMFGTKLGMNSPF